MARKILGLKVWNKALENSSREDIINKSIEVCKEFPGIWGNGWSNFDWVLGNVVRDVAYPKSTRDIAMTWNADDVLTSDELEDIKKNLNFNSDYIKTFK
jgi:hypothetical protein